MKIKNGSLSMKRLYRSREDKKIAGICGGIGETFSIDPTLVRLIFVFIFTLLVVFGRIAIGIIPILVTYVVGWVIVPLRPPQEEKEN